MDAILYIRFSTKDQDKGDSTKRQTNLGIAAAQANGWTITETLADKGKSAYHGKNRSKGGKLYDIEERAKRGELAGKVLLVEAMDRLTRQKPLESLSLMRDLTESGLTICETGTNRIYNTKAIDDNWTNLVVILAAAAEAYGSSHSKSGRIKSGWAASQQRGTTRDGHDDPRIMPRWMTVVDGKYQLIEERAHWIRQLYQWACEGLSTYAIARKLNQEPAAKWGKGSWEPANVRALIRSRNALGEYLPQTRSEEGKRIPTGDWVYRYPAVIDEATWYLAQDALSKRAVVQPSGKNRYANLLAGMATCGVGGGPLYLVTYKGTKNDKGQESRSPRLYCKNHRNNATCTAKTSYIYPPLEKGVLDALLIEVINAPSQSIDPLQQKVTMLDLRLAELQKRLDTTTRNLQEVFSKSLAQAAADLENEIDTTKQERDEAQREQRAKSNAPTAPALVNEVRRLRSQLDDPEMRLRVNLLLRNIVTYIRMDPATREAIVILLGGLAAFKLDKDGYRVGAPVDARPAYELEPELVTRATIGERAGQRMMLDNVIARRA